jgi:hypothetical protein
MKTSAYLGANIGKIPFTHFVTFKKYGNKSFKASQNVIEDFFEQSSSICILNYNIERNLESYLHSHILILAECYVALLYDINSFVKPIRFETITRTTMVKTLKSSTDISTGVVYKDQIVEINGYNYTSKKMNMYVEPIINSYNAAEYSNKFNDYGLGNGFLKR